MATSSAESLIAEAKRRLAHQPVSLTQTIAQLRKRHKLSDEAELALRLVPTPRLEKLLKNMKELDSSIADPGVKDKNRYVLDLIAAIDQKVLQLLKGLIKADSAAAAPTQRPSKAKIIVPAFPQDVRPPAVKAKVVVPPTKAPGLPAKKPAAPVKPPVDAPDPKWLKKSAKRVVEDPVVEAKRRLAAPKRDSDKKVVKQLVADFELSEDVELSLMLLKPMHLREFVVGEEQLREKLNESEDPASIVTMLAYRMDPQVQALLQRLKCIESEEIESEGNASSAKITPTKASSARLPRDSAAPSNPPKARGSVSAESAKRPASNSAFPKRKRTKDELISEVDARTKNKTLPTKIRAFLEEHELDPAIELSLRMLTMRQLMSMWKDKETLSADLWASHDRTEDMLRCLSKIDAEVVDITRQLIDADTGESESTAPPAKKAFKSTWSWSW